MDKQYNLYRVECAEQSTPIDREDNAIDISNFETLEEAVKFME